MDLTTRIAAFSQLGQRIRTLSAEEKEMLLAQAQYQNAWFTNENVSLSLAGIHKFLARETLTEWVTNYSLENTVAKNVGVAMAGNIPLVGFHDLLCVLLSGHTLHAKLSQQDTFLMTWMVSQLIAIEPAFEQRITVRDRLNGIDAVIATGSDNTSRYFDYYFRDIPHIIRKNRSSCAIILGEESEAELEALATDVFSYFGLGCRNVSKIYVPEKYDFTAITAAFERYSSIFYHHKYMNNYTYQKTIMQMNSVPFVDTGFLLMREEESLVSPLSVIFYEYYKDQADLNKKVKSNEAKIQCISSATAWFAGSVAFGQTQLPTLTDYADGIDTLRFLEGV